MQNHDLEKKDQIKQAARNLFFRFGFSKTSMSDIAKQCDLAKPTLYYYYKSKEEIFDEVVIDEAQMFMNEVESQIPPNLPADQRLAIFFTTIYEGKKQYAEKMADLPDYLREHSPHGHPIIKKMRDLFKQKVIPMLNAGREAGVLAFEDAQNVAETLIFMMEFLNLDWMRHFPTAHCDAVFHTMNEIIMNGLKRRNE